MPKLTKKQKLAQKFDRAMPTLDNERYNLHLTDVATLASIADKYSHQPNCLNIRNPSTNEQILIHLAATLIKIRAIKNEDQLSYQAKRTQHLEQYENACNTLIVQMETARNTNIDTINAFKLAILKLSILFYAIDQQKHQLCLGPRFFPTRGNYLAPSFRSKIYTDKMAELRAKALVALKQYINSHTYAIKDEDKISALALLKEARELPIFAMHRNHLHGGGFLRTNAQQDIDRMISQVTNGEEIALDNYRKYDAQNIYFH